MSQRHRALKYVEHFCSGAVDELASLLTKDFQLDGPFLKAGSREEYISALTKNTMKKGSHQIHRVFEEEDAVCVWYDYIKADSAVLIAQVFEFSEDRICASQLVFDSGAVV